MGFFLKPGQQLCTILTPGSIVYTYLFYIKGTFPVHRVDAPGFWTGSQYLEVEYFQIGFDSRLLKR